MIALITNSIRPYCFDAARVLGLPEGATHRFRYRSKWIDPTIEVADLKGKSSVIVLRNFDTASFVPLRVAKISDVQVLGDTIYLEFVVENYATDLFRLKCDVELQNHFQSRSIDNVPGKHLEPIVIDLETLTGEQVAIQPFSEQIKLWDEISTTLGSYPSFENYSFFKLISVKSVEGKDCILVPGDAQGKKAFAVLPSAPYSLELLQKIPWEMDKSEQINVPFTVQISSPDSDLAIRRGVQKVVGKYDLLKFILVTPDSAGKRFVTIDFQTCDGQEIDSHAPFLSVTLKVLPSKWRRFVFSVRLFGTIGGVVVMGISNDLADLTSWSSDLYRALAILLIIIAADKWDKVLEKIVDSSKDIKSSILKN